MNRWVSAKKVRNEVQGEIASSFSREKSSEFCRALHWKIFILLINYLQKERSSKESKFCDGTKLAGNVKTGQRMKDYRKTL